MIWRMALAGLAACLFAQAATGQMDGPEAEFTVDRVHPAWSEYQPAFVETICPFMGRTAYDPEKIFCGHVLVPEDRTREDSRLIQIAILVMKSTSAAPPLGAIMRLDGGPGGPSLSPGRVAAYQLPENARLLDLADLVFFDQRGIGYSEGRFCRAVPLPYQFGLPVQPDGQARFDYEMTRCIAEARQRGIMVEGYTNWQNALDVRDIRRALGYEQWNLFGVSYGTELAQGVMQVDAEGTRAAVLDSVVPAALETPDIDQLTLNGFRSALDAISESCRADPACARAHPDLGDELVAAIGAFADAPLVIEPVAPSVGQDRLVIDARTLGDAIFQALYSRDFYDDLPAILRVLQTRDEAALRAYVDVLGYPLDHSYGRGMSVTVNCRAGFRETPGAPPPPGPDGTALAGLLGSTNFHRSCASLFTDAPDPTVRRLVSDIPTLVLAGANDPITPPYYADILMAGLSQGQRVDYPHTGHGALLTHWNTCGRELMAAFLKQPTVAVDAGCAAAIAPPDFLVSLRETKAPYRFGLNLQAGRYPVPVVIAAAGLAAILLSFFLTPIARRVDGSPSADYGRARLLAVIGGAASLAGLVLAIRTILSTATAHTASLPVGVPASIGWAGWLGLAGFALCLIALWRWHASRGRAGRRLGTALALFGAALACAYLLWFLFSIDAGPVVF